MNKTILCLDVGNTHIFGGVYECKEGNPESLSFTFRHNTSATYTSDELGIFLRTVLRENAFVPADIQNIAICSVVPHLDYSLQAACKKYFGIDPFILQGGVKTGIEICYANPREVGADIIASAIAAVNLYPQQNVIVADLGTATTFCALTDKRKFLGGLIMPGIRLCMESLQSHTAKLPRVNIVKPEKIIGASTIESIQAGLYFSHLGAIREIVNELTEFAFSGQKPLVIGTGGFAHLFSASGVFTTIVPAIVLDGLLQAFKMNRE